MRGARTLAILCVLTAVGCTSAPEGPTEADLSDMLRKAASDSEARYDYPAAVRHFRQLRERLPHDVPAVLGLARNLRYEGAPRQAVRLLKTAIEEAGGESPGLVLELGKAQLASAIIGEAAATLERAVALAPESWDAHATLGIVRDREGRFPEARASYRRALELSPGNVAVSNNLALSWALDGEIDKGIAILSTIVAGENATPLTRQNLALLFAIKGDLGRAERLARQDLPAETVSQNLEVLRESYAAPWRPGAKAPETPEKAAGTEAPRKSPEKSIQSLGW